MGSRQEEAATEYFRAQYAEFLEHVQLQIYANPEQRPGHGQANPLRVLDHVEEMENWASEHQLDRRVFTETLIRMYEVLLEARQSKAAALLAQKYDL